MGLEILIQTAGYNGVHIVPGFLDLLGLQGLQVFPVLTWLFCLEFGSKFCVCIEIF